MAMLTWIVGQGGLLGSELRKACEAKRLSLWESPQFPWERSIELEGAFSEATSSFADALKKNRANRFVIVWAAGKGTVGTPESALNEETRSWEAFLSAVSSELLPHHPTGTIFFSSSAGAIYAGAGGSLITEDTPPHPLSAYGRTKLEQEKIFLAWTEQHSSVAAIIGRISNLYGERQNLTKAQGIISHISERILRRAPIHIYVPLDTIRDYVYAGDCARAIMEFLLQRQGIPKHLLKIFASERTTTIAEILGIFTRIAKTPPHIVCGRTENAKEHPRCVRFHSTVARDILPFLQHTSLLEGIYRLHEHQRRLFEKGVLHPVPLRSSGPKRSV
jgi:UDP-glucose 4-epimerase